MDLKDLGFEIARGVLAEIRDDPRTGRRRKRRRGRNGYEITIPGPSISLAKLITPYIGGVHKFGPCTITVPKPFRWTPQVLSDHVRLDMEVYPSLKIDFKLLGDRIHVPIFADLRWYEEWPSEYLVGVQALGGIIDCIRVARDWSSPE